MTARRGRLPNASKARQTDSSGAGDDAPPATRNGTTERGRKTRGRIVTAARRIFERDGFLHARISDICAEAATSHGSFYTYFSSKEEVFKEVTDSVEVDLLSIASSGKHTDEVDRIRDANSKYFERFESNARILTVIQQVATFDPAVRATRIRRQDAFAEDVERRIRRLQGAGTVDMRLNPAFAANALGGMVAFMAEKVFIEGRSSKEIDPVDQLTILWANALGLKHD